MTTLHTSTSSELLPSNECKSNDTNPNLLQLFGQIHRWPQQITVEPSRLNIGLWGYNEGDISEAYCADTFPKVKIFLHEGYLFANTGGSDVYAFCHPLIPSAEYNDTGKKPYSYEGESVTYKGQSFKLGPKTKFTARERTVEEETDLLRRKYAYGGFFVSGKTYRELLLASLDKNGIKQGLETAIKQELERTDLPNTQNEMIERLGENAKLPEVVSSSELSQPSLPGF